MIGPAGFMAGPQRSDPVLLNGYKAFYRGKKCEVYAETSYQAQLKAAEVFKAKKPNEVHVMLCELKGVQYVHTAT